MIRAGFSGLNSETVHKSIQGTTYRDISTYANDGGAVMEFSYHNGDSVNFSLKSDGQIIITRKHNGTWLPEIKLADAWT